MPSVQVFVKTYFEICILWPMQNADDVFAYRLWRDVGVTFGSIVENTGTVLYDEGCVYIFYKQTGGSNAFIRNDW